MSGWAGSIAIVGFITVFIAHRGGIQLSTVAVPGWWPQAVGWTGFIIVGFVLFGIAFAGDVLARQHDDPRDSGAGQVASIIQGVGLLGILWVFWQVWQSTTFTFRDFWWIPVALAAVYVGFVYAQHRRRVASSSTAINRTRNTVNDSFSDWANLAVGGILVAFAVGFAILSGALTALGQSGELLLPFMGEIAYLGTIILGYVSLGGSMPGDWLIPELSAVQFVGIALFIGGLALMFREVT